MKVTIGENTYSKITSLVFSPQTDLTGNKLPINNVQVQIHTTDNIDIGVYLYLYDDLDRLWAKYWITYAEHHDKETLTIRASSVLTILERKILDPVMYNNEPIANVIETIFDRALDEYTLDSAFDGITVSGFCPEQSARNRLQMVTLVIGAYVKSYFSDKIQILPIDDTPVLIPREDTYWKPKITYSDYVTRVRAFAYSFTPGTPSSTDQWVTDGTTTYIVSKHSVSFANPDAPAAAPTHEITVDNLMLINDDNIDDVLTHLSTYYFGRTTVEADVINNGEYLPGERVQVYADNNIIAEGFIEGAAFTFGTQAKSRLSITPVELINAGNLIVTHVYHPDGLEDIEILLGTKEYTLPVPYPYEIENPFHDETWGYERYIFRPETDTITGTVQEGQNEVEVEYLKALRFCDGDLEIVSVDDLSVTDGVVAII
jgi:hypothetical protein